MKTAQLWHKSVTEATKKKEKDFDCVKMMRDIRDKMSREMMNMTHKEQLAYIQNLLEKGKTKKPAKATA
ncbi:MAG: hypothetical protein IPM59_12750 [Chloracidobacterium sp.]|nr:hypothetical protein [Chloracidobacterium sp.]